jgi:predicted ribosome quality control (RQC) complex YloA/Tae2 family protein
MTLNAKPISTTTDLIIHCYQKKKKSKNKNKNKKKKKKTEKMKASEGFDVWGK